MMAMLVMGSTEASCSSEYQEVGIIMADFRFTPSLIQLSSKKPLRVRIFNQGREPHIFQSRLFRQTNVETFLDGENSPFIPPHQEIILKPGDSVTLIIKAPPGIYDYRCPIRGHKGMEGMIQVS